ncbi:DUF3049 domain-containing protein, partial [Cephalotus follicularis]
MATILYQGLQSYLEPQLGEPKTLRLKLSSRKPHFLQPLELLDSKPKDLQDQNCYLVENTSNKTDFLHDNKLISANHELGSLCFLQALSPTSQPPNEANDTTKQAYVHPLQVKRSLSEKSLELCTENLGSETGTDDIIENSTIFSLSTYDTKSGNNYSPAREQPRKAEKANARSYPPPLTTISGSESLQVRSHREDGRLVVKAFKTPPHHTTFQAERSNGNLRLSFFKHDFDEVITEEVEVSNEDDNNEVKFDEEKELEQEEEEEDEEEYNDAYYGEDMDGNSLDAGAEMGMEKFRIIRSCKEGECEKKRLLNWGPLWVAT